METESVAPIRTAPDLISKHSGGVQTLTYMHTRGQVCLHTAVGGKTQLHVSLRKKTKKREKKTEKARAQGRCQCRGRKMKQAVREENLQQIRRERGKWGAVRKLNRERQKGLVDRRK